MQRKKKRNVKYSTESKISVIMDMRERARSGFETVKKIFQKGGSLPFIKNAKRPLAARGYRLVGDSRRIPKALRKAFYSLIILRKQSQGGI